MLQEKERTRIDRSGKGTQLGGSAFPAAQGDGIGDRRCRGASSGVTSFALVPPASMALVASNRTTWPWPFRRAMSIGVRPRQVASAGAPALSKAATLEVRPRAAATWRGAAPF